MDIDWPLFGGAECRPTTSTWSSRAGPHRLSTLSMSGHMNPPVPGTDPLFGVAVLNILIVEDHPFIAEMMRDFLLGWDRGMRAHVCSDAQTTLARIHDPGIYWDRIFLDIDVPGAYGLSLAKAIQVDGLQARCCVVTALDQPALIAEVQAMGFLGYIVKASAYSDFVKSVARVMANERSFPSTDRGHQHASFRLTRRQEQLLGCVRLGMSSKEIAAACFLSEGTVNNCITAATRALNAKSRSHAVSRAIELGLLTIEVRQNSSDERCSMR